MFKGFRDFILRGNVVDLAVGIIMGAAFGAIVTALVEDIITPLIGAIFGTPDFSAIMLGPLKVGLFLNAVVSFLFIAIGVYFFVVLPVNRIMAFTKKQEAVSPPSPTTEEKLLMEIRDALKAGR